MMITHGNTRTDSSRSQKEAPAVRVNETKSLVRTWISRQISNLHLVLMAISGGEARKRYAKALIDRICCYTAFFNLMKRIMNNMKNTPYTPSNMA